MNRSLPARRPLSRKQLFALLRERPGEGRDFDARIAERSERELTIFAADSSGFSKKTFRHGIVRFLANLVRSYDRIIPLIETHGGTVTTQNADNILAVFEDTAGAVRAAGAVHAWLARRNRSLPAADRFELCIGIHHGPVLRLADDVYGATVNVCAKIGEDVARRNETLVTDAVVARAPRFTYTRRGTAVIGGETIRLHRVRT